METGDVLATLFDQKIVSIIKLFLRDDSKQYYLREIAKLTKVSPASTYRILKRLVDLQVLKVTEIKTAKLYSLEAGKTVDFLKSILEVDVVQAFVDQVKEVKGVEELYLYGKKEKSKATLFIVGSEIDNTNIKQIISDFKTRYSFNILDHFFTKDQYEKVQGLFSESKKLLYKKI